MRKNEHYPNRDKSSPSCTMGVAIKPLKCVKDLGVLISYDLTWGGQVDAAVNKANKILGIIYRTIGPTNQEAFSTLYITFVRPILEYAAPVWCPYLVKDVLALEKVQRRASRLALGHKRGEMEYEERIKILNWPTLEKWRHFISLIECYKIVFGFNSLKFRDFVELALDKMTQSNHSFNYKLSVKNARVNSYKYSFFIRIVKEWNNLPQYVVEAESFKLFKTRLKSFFNM